MRQKFYKVIEANYSEWGNWRYIGWKPESIMEGFG
jgi:hypothetical protein